MNAVGLGHLFYLRLINVFFVFYGVNRTIKMNLAEGEKISSLIASLHYWLASRCFLSILGLIIYSYLQVVILMFNRFRNIPLETLLFAYSILYSLKE
jgi:hypothetical protein